MIRTLCVVGVVLAAGPHLSGQPAAQPAQVNTRLDRLTRPYRPMEVPATKFQNSTRIDDLLRAGQLYLSLPDAIALALENNLDVELQRYGPGIAATDLLRTQGGATNRGVTLTVGETPTGLGGPASPLLNVAAGGTLTGSSTVSGNVSNLGQLTASQTNLSISQGTFATGPLPPSYDPAIVGSWNYTHQTTPQSSTVVTGANLLINRLNQSTIGISQGFSSGTQVGLNFNSSSQNSNSVRTSFNPYTNSSLGITLTQPLLRGFGPSLNKRFIRISQNGRKLADLTFRQQLIATVSGVMRLYYDLVSLNEDVRVKNQTLALAEKLQSDVKAQVGVGTMAPTELARAQAQVAAARQDQINSQAFAREQELILKTVLTRRGTADAAIRDAHIITTDTTPAPDGEPVRPIQDLIADANAHRPDLAAAGLQLDNAQLSLKGSRNSLLPEIDFVATAQNNGLAGQVNPLASTGGPFVSTPSPTFIGGFGLTLGQIFRRNYPTYGAGIQVNLPIRNRVAQGDVARDEIQLRQTQIRRQQLENQVRLEVEDAVIGLERARAAYEAAMQTRTLQEISLDAEQKKYAAGLSTTFLVSQYQSFVAQARSTEVAARGAYAKARVALQRALGLTLDENGISVDEVYKGQLSRRSTPAVGTGGQAAR